MHENVEKEVTWAPEEVGPDFDKDRITPELTRIYTNKDHLSIALIELRLRIQFRGSGVKEGLQRLEIWTTAQKWMTMHENVKNFLVSNPSPRRGKPRFRQGSRNSETYTNLHEQRPPVNSMVRVESAHSIS
ncbi:hypothetical protein TNIN_233081 [Trichonephila inaurata madagascariensis]|uniref:Uncharacterized protein n=1 Tax=Trichonephila inaurata madagascariensis TaxID=2747483 RepID=A0A8X6YJY0_9ARAC|nr:hypothetical protein TNIN_233081 [Trichonephila inaurata madagascariensis]